MSAPAYSVQTAHYHGAYYDHTPPPPYPTALPETFPIGNQKCVPVVDVSELHFHLRILGAFSTLRQNVRSAAERQKGDADAAWAVFLARAVHRFSSWVAQVRPLTAGTIPSDQLPPLDVLMVWHSYLLVSPAMTAFALEAPHVSIS